MENLSKHKVIWHSMADGLSLGGWSCCCEFYEIIDEQGNVLAQVGEDVGTIIRPNHSNNYFQRSYANIIIGINLLEVHNDYILIEIHNKYNQVKRLYYYDKA